MMLVTRRLLELKLVGIGGVGEVALHRVAPGDFDSFQEILSIPQVHRGSGICKSSYPATEAVITSEFNRFAQEGWGLTVEIEGKPQGFMHLDINRYSGRLEPWIMVSPEYWGRGVGGGVVREVLGCFPTLGAEAMVPLANTRASRMAVSSGLAPQGPGAVVGGFETAWYLLHRGEG